MIKGIPKDVHGIIDYSYVPLVLAAPKLGGFDNDKKAAAVTSAFAAFALGYSLLTDAKWGVIKLIPYKTHAMLDLSSGVTAAAAPWVFNISDKRARNTLLIMALAGLTVGTLSLIGASKNS